jgi:hypothetical protein
VRGLAYETAWIRQFAPSFGNTIVSFSTVISVFLGGLAPGAALGGRLQSRRGLASGSLALYGMAEIRVGVYALAIPWLMGLAPDVLSPLHGPAGSGLIPVPIARALLCAPILLSATIPMGAGLPWLVTALRAKVQSHSKLVWIYAVNTPGGRREPSGRD